MAVPRTIHEEKTPVFRTERRRGPKTDLPLSGHEYAKRQLARQGIGFEALDKCDPKRRLRVAGREGMMRANSRQRDRILDDDELRAGTQAGFRLKWIVGMSRGRREHERAT